MKSILNYSLFFLLFCFVGCEDQPDNETECDSVACTYIYVSLTINIVDAQNEPVELDSYKVILTENSEDITPEDLDINKSGTYILFSDQFATRFQNKETEVRFVGFKDDMEIVSGEFMVGADCCHVKMLSSNTTLVVP